MSKEVFMGALHEGRDIAEQRTAADLAMNRRDEEELAKARELAAPLTAVIDILTTLPEDDKEKTFRGGVGDQLSRQIGTLRYDRSDYKKESSSGLGIMVDSAQKQPFSVDLNFKEGRARSHREGPFEYHGSDADVAIAAILRWAGSMAPHRVDEIAGRLRAD